jgi:hypothetical protein
MRESERFVDLRFGVGQRAQGLSVGGRRLAFSVGTPRPQGVREIGFLAEFPHAGICRSRTDRIH